MSAEPRILSVRELFTGAWHFRVPVYQRAYAWGREEIETLVRDIAASLNRSAYHVGSLVLHQVRGADDSQLYDVIDGQQRLTTFFLLLSHPALRRPLAKRMAFTFPGRILSFEERNRSTSDLARLAALSAGEDPQLADEGIAAAVATIDALLGTEDRLERIMREQGASERCPQTARDAWLSFLLDRVKITVSELPHETDLNHYFEVMNTRGVQLEKHEVVKAHLIGLLGDDEHARSLFNRVWDAVSDFSRPVQACFSPEERSRLFGPPTPGNDSDEGDDVRQGWAVLQPTSADELFDRPAGADAEPSCASPELDLDLVLDGMVTAPDLSRLGQTDDEGRYGAIIDFPNFLLHVLRLHLDPAEVTVALDDKQLVAQFDREVTNKHQCLDFTYRLLRAKYLFDNYVIKTREDATSTGETRWMLGRFHSTGSATSLRLSPVNAFSDSRLQQRILMVQAMYQVTQSRRVYKQFLFSILWFLDSQWQLHRRIDGATFLGHLHEMAEEDLARLDKLDELLDTGTGVPHFALNLLDYKLWLCAQPDSGFDVSVDTQKLPGVSEAVARFSFAYRTSVEHFLAVNFAEGDERDVVDCFGNLCLMTRVENSRRSDHDPSWKVRKYGDTDQSLKFSHMAALQRARASWGTTEINDQGAAMRKVLTTPLPDQATATSPAGPA